MVAGDGCYEVDHSRPGFVTVFAILEAMQSLRQRRRATIQTRADLPRQPTPPPLPKPGDWTDI